MRRKNNFFGFVLRISSKSTQKYKTIYKKKDWNKLRKARIQKKHGFKKKRKKEEKKEKKKKKKEKKKKKKKNKKQNET